MQFETRTTKAINQQVTNTRVRAFLHEQDDFEAALYLSIVDDVDDIDEGIRTLTELFDHGWEAYGPFRGFDEFDFWEYAWDAYRVSEHNSFLAFLDERQGSIDNASADGIEELVLGISVEETALALLARIDVFDWEDDDE